MGNTPSEIPTTAGPDSTSEGKRPNRYQQPLYMFPGRIENRGVD